MACSPPAIATGHGFPWVGTSWKRPRGGIGNLATTRFCSAGRLEKSVLASANAVAMMLVQLTIEHADYRIAITRRGSLGLLRYALVAARNGIRPLRLWFVLGVSLMGRQPDRLAQILKRESWTTHLIVPCNSPVKRRNCIWIRIGSEGRIRDEARSNSNGDGHVLIAR